MSEAYVPSSTPEFAREYKILLACVLACVLACLLVRTAIQHTCSLSVCLLAYNTIDVVLRRMISYTVTYQQVLS